MRVKYIYEYGHMYMKVEIYILLMRDVVNGFFFQIYFRFILYE